MPAQPGWRSGLRNPGAAVRGVGGAALGMQALVLLLAVSPLARLGGERSTDAIWFVLGLAVLAVLLAALLRHRWAWRAGALVPIALLPGGLLHWSLAVLGVLFGGLWMYVLHVRRLILGSAGDGAGPTGGSPSASA